MIQMELFKNGSKPKRPKKQPQEWKVVSLRECPTPEYMHKCDSPQLAADYWRMHIINDKYFDPERECLIVLMLNTRGRIKGHTFISIGSMDSILVHPREVFRAAILIAASDIILMHNHPSGEARPSDADIRVTHDLMRAGKILKIQVCDHIIMGNPKFCSLREMGFCYIGD